MHPCPIPGCLASSQSMAKDTLIRHLSRTHIQAGQGIPTSVLDNLGLAVCTPCRHLHRKTEECSFCKNRSRGHVTSPSESVAPASRPPFSSPPPDIAEMGGTSLDLPSPSFSPTMADVMAANITTMRHVPSSCRASLANLLGGALLQLAQQPTWEALYTIVCAPKLILRTAGNKGTQTVHQTSQDVRRRMQLFHAGNYGTFWAEACAKLPTKAKKPLK